MKADARRTRLSRVVETPAGKGHIVGASQLADGWRVRVELSSGGSWAGPAKELSGARDVETLREFRRKLGEKTED
jgi:hypothetical protein